MSNPVPKIMSTKLVLSTSLFNPPPIIYASHSTSSLLPCVWATSICTCSKIYQGQKLKPMDWAWTRNWVTHLPNLILWASPLKVRPQLDHICPRSGPSLGTPLPLPGWSPCSPSGSFDFKKWSCPRILEGRLTIWPILCALHLQGPKSNIYVHFGLQYLAFRLIPSSNFDDQLYGKAKLILLSNEVNTRYLTTLKMSTMI